MHRYLYLCVALAVVGPALISQARSQDQSAAPASRQQQAPTQPPLHQDRGPDQRVPAAQYSPLAAQGGYSRARSSPLDAMVQALNPRDVNLGAMWEERRRAWLENAGANRYFWYSFGATIVVILSWFALAWVQNDRVRERWQLAVRLIHRVYESDGVTVRNGRNKLFLRQLTPEGTRPDVYLFRISPTDTGWLDRAGAWRCDAAQVVSFSEGNGQQEALIVLPPFGWVHGTQGTFCAEPWRDRPWLAVLSRAVK